MNQKAFMLEVERITRFVSKEKKIYIYGAGKYGDGIKMLLDRLKIPIRGMIVSKKNGYERNDIPVYQFNEVTDSSFCIIFAMKSEFIEDVFRFNKGLFEIPFLIFEEAFYRFCFNYFSWLRSIENREGTKDLYYGYIFFNQYKGKKCILLKRGSGLGDVLMAEPVVRQLKKMGYIVFFATKSESIFLYNTDLDGLFNIEQIPPMIESASLSIDLNYEANPNQHVLDAYISCVKNFIPNFDIPKNARIPSYNNQLIIEHSKSVRRVCINNEAHGWKNRVLPKEKIKEFANYLLTRGYEIFEIGLNQENYLGIGKNCYGLELSDTIRLMATMDLYVGVDNGLMHFAQAIRLPVFVLFGSVCPNYRIHDWSLARVMWKNVDELPCAGCHHRRGTNWYPECIQDDVLCLDWTTEEIIEAFENKEYNAAPLLHPSMRVPLAWAEL